MLVHRRVIPSIKFSGSRLYTWVERDAARVKCPTQCKNTTQCPRPGLEHGNWDTNYEATAPPTLEGINK